MAGLPPTGMTCAHVLYHVYACMAYNGWYSFCYPYGIKEHYSIKDILDYLQEHLPSDVYGQTVNLFHVVYDDYIEFNWELNIDLFNMIFYDLLPRLLSYLSYSEYQYFLFHIGYLGARYIALIEPHEWW